MGQSSTGGVYADVALTHTANIGPMYAAVGALNVGTDITEQIVQTKISSSDQDLH